MTTDGKKASTTLDQNGVTRITERISQNYEDLPNFVDSGKNSKSRETLCELNGTRNKNDVQMKFKSGRVSPAPDAERPDSTCSQTRKSAWDRARDKFNAQQLSEKKNRSHYVSSQDVDLLSSKKHFSLKSLIKVFKSKRFKTDKLERLYQRYFFKLNQNSLIILMAFVCVIAVILTIFYYVDGAALPARGVNLAVVLITLIVLEIVCNRGAFDQQQMIAICYIILVLLCGVVTLITLDSSPHSLSDGVWCTVIFTYMIYTLLPVRMRVAVFSGLFISVIQVSCSIGKNISDDIVWKQVSDISSYLNT